MNLLPMDEIVIWRRYWDAQEARAKWSLEALTHAESGDKDRYEFAELRASEASKRVRIAIREIQNYNLNQATKN